MYAVVPLLFAFLLGAIIGSFLNVVALRLLKDESIIWPPSHCPLCSHQLGPRDLIPVLSYILLRGKCRYCHGRISSQYPLVEAATGAVFALLFWKYGLTWKSAWLAVFISVLIISTIADLNEMTVPLVPLAVGLSGVIFLKLTAGMLGLCDILTGLACYVLFAFPARLGLMGDGDAPVAALVGFTLGPAQAVEAFFWALMLGGLYGAALLVKDSRNRKKQIPLVPFLTAGSVTAVLMPGVFTMLAGL